MRKPNFVFLNLKSRSGQLLPYAVFGAIVFAGVSIANFNDFLSMYLVLLTVQLGTLGIYLIFRTLKSKNKIG